MKSKLIVKHRAQMAQYLKSMAEDLDSLERREEFLAGLEKAFDDYKALCNSWGHHQLIFDGFPQLPMTFAGAFLLVSVYQMSEATDSVSIDLYSMPDYASIADFARYCTLYMQPKLFWRVTRTSTTMRWEGHSPEFQNTKVVINLHQEKFCQGKEIMVKQMVYDCADND